jgi:hypothetical protein
LLVNRAYVDENMNRRFFLSAVRPLINAILDTAEELSDYPWKQTAS